ncbi:hsp70 family protein [Blastopirellula marina]|uniref:Probable chaperone protein DnaK n=1 Tax=Blastopirellula marina DSM 3645 TaxID=314230 RepID=A4A0F9_9BACT|nr:hsp70 family protein [Blastopirellula marina]EAQ77779.1 probable chaperone protein DnaK [Blastopirellula marina DSM 3645]
MVKHQAAATSGDEDAPSRYVVGIDLGTTNSAVAYVDTEAAPGKLQSFSIPQIVAPQQIEARSTLPSFHYEAAKSEFPADALQLPWSKPSANYCVGMFARDHGITVPSRVINSAKSWLSHTGVDRTAALLPWHGASDLEKLSPLTVSARLLAHIRAAWNDAHPQHPLEQQDIVLTLPASFDEIARELTVAAAAEAGLKRVVLIEEPQAAFYAWLDKHQENWETLVSPGQTILVCDIGGGTSDFTLIRVRQGEDGKVQFHRVAVGEHLILGGDNLDLTLATYLEQRLTSGGKLSPGDWSTLVRRCRVAKEEMLTNNAPDEITINLPSGGSKLIGGGRQATLTKSEIEQVLVDGFLPAGTIDTPLEKRSSGFQEFGLPFANDPAITRHLSAFLRNHHHVVEEESVAVRPDIVLFNGGFFESSRLRRKLIDEITAWFLPTDPQFQLQILDNDRLDLAVARGAAYYGLVRRGEGVRIAANLARTYYIGVGQDEQGKPQALCILPATTQPGEEIDLQARTFRLRVSEPVEFPLFVSSIRLIDKAGEIVSVDQEQIRSLPPIRTVLRAKRRSEATEIAVKLHARLTEIGTIELWCDEIESDRRWRLQFDVRSATQTDVAAHVSDREAEGVLDEEIWSSLQSQLTATFGETATLKPQRLLQELETTSEMARNQWPASLLRRIWGELLDLEPGRRRSSSHEIRWLNLVGFALRPGYGLALDDWRVSETWKALQGKVVHNDANCRVQSWILWRRIAGGLNRGQQKAVAEPLLQAFRGLHRRVMTGQGTATFTPQESLEAWRLLGGLELLDVSTKLEIGGWIVDLLSKPKMASARSAMAWTLGRLASRTPVYGPLNSVISAEIATRWLAAIYRDRNRDPMDLLAVMQIARLTDDRYRDLASVDREEAAVWLETENAPSHFARIVRAGGNLDHEERDQVFGEALPIGLTL